MFNEIIKNGGGTLNKKGVVTFEKGYMVGAQNLATIEYGAHDLYTIIEIWNIKEIIKGF